MGVMAIFGNEKKQQLTERTAKFANGIRGISKTSISVGRLRTVFWIASGSVVG
jgi:hypothetical protein